MIIYFCVIWVARDLHFIYNYPMRYYVVADTHGFYTHLTTALEEAGYFADQSPKKLLMLGDLLDRGHENVEMQDFVLDLLQKDAVILVRGNHEDLLEDLVDNLDHYAELELHATHHYRNRTVHTVCDLARCSVGAMTAIPYQIRSRMRQTPYMRLVMPEMIDYFETEHYVFVHGWVPLTNLAPAGLPSQFAFDPEWRDATLDRWNKARWYNGMEMAAKGLLVPGKTVVCGHYHCSWGHHLAGTSDEYGPSADYSPYYAEGIIAIDACTALSRRVNVLVLDD